MRFVFLLLAGFAGLVWWMLHAEPQFVDSPIAHHAVDDLSGFADDPERIRLAMDYDISSDGNGSLRIEADHRELVTLYVVHEERDISYRRLVYQAKVRTQDVQGPVFLVMQAGITPGPAGGMPVIGIERAEAGSQDWTELEAFAGNPSNTRHFFSKLQIDIGGPGTVWVDDVRLLSRQAI
jgi:hypothetical protein